MNYMSVEATDMDVARERKCHTWEEEEETKELAGEEKEEKIEVIARVIEETTILMQKKDYDAAESAVMNSIVNDEEDLPLHMLLAECYLSQNKAEQLQDTVRLIAMGLFDRHAVDFAISVMQATFPLPQPSMTTWPAQENSGRGKITKKATSEERSGMSVKIVTLNQLTTQEQYPESDVKAITISPRKIQRLRAILLKKSRYVPAMMLLRMESDLHVQDDSKSVGKLKQINSCLDRICFCAARLRPRDDKLPLAFAAECAEEVFADLEFVAHPPLLDRREDVVRKSQALAKMTFMYEKIDKTDKMSKLLGKVEELEREFKSIETTGNDYKIVLQNLSRIYQRFNQFKKAELFLEKAIKFVQSYPSTSKRGYEITSMQLELKRVSRYSEKADKERKEKTDEQDLPTSRKNEHDPTEEKELVKAESHVTLVKVERHEFDEELHGAQEYNALVAELNAKIEYAWERKASETIGPDGGKITLPDCFVEIPPGVMEEEDELVISTCSQPRGLPSDLWAISPTVKCKPTMKMKGSVKVTVETWFAAQKDDDALTAKVMYKKGPGHRWECIQTESLPKTYQMSFDVTCFCQFVLAVVRDVMNSGEHRLVTNFFIQRGTGMGVAVFFRDRACHSNMKEDFAEGDYAGGLAVPEEIHVRTGSEISLKATCRKPTRTKMSEGKPSSSLQIDENFMKKNSNAVYFEPTKEMSRHKGQVLMDYHVTIKGKKPLTYPLSVLWSKGEQTTAPQILIGENIATGRGRIKKSSKRGRSKIGVTMGEKNAKKR